MEKNKKSSISEESVRIRSGPFWAELRIFLAVARSGSFSRATRILNCSQPTIGRALKRLEDVIGTRLAVPNSKGIFLTEAGKQLAYTLSKLDRELSDVASNLRQNSYNYRGTAIISCPEAICGFLIAPELPQFSSKNPNICISIISKKTISSLKNNDYDILITTSKYFGADLEIRNGGFINFKPMASSEYLRKFGIPTMSNLSAHRFVDSPVYDASISASWMPWRRLLDGQHVAHTCENSFPYGLGRRLINP
jgi:DNA-binding transcriptional LysR family regulator